MQRREGNYRRPQRHDAARESLRWSRGRSLESGGTASGVSGPGAPGRTSLTHSLPRQADPDSLSLQRSWASTPQPRSEIPRGLSRLRRPLDHRAGAQGTGSSLGSPYPLNPLQSKAKAKPSQHEPLCLPTAPSRRGPAPGPRGPRGHHWAGGEGCRQEEQLRLRLARPQGHVRPAPTHPRGPGSQTPWTATATEVVSWRSRTDMCPVWPAWAGAESHRGQAGLLEKGAHLPCTVEKVACEFEFDLRCLHSVLEESPEDLLCPQRLSSWPL